MVQVGKVYELSFGKDIFIKYRVSNINYDNDLVELTKIQDEMNGSKIEYIPIEKLYKKRKIRNW